MPEPRWIEADYRFAGCVWWGYSRAPRAAAFAVSGHEVVGWFDFGIVPYVGFEDEWPDVRLHYAPIEDGL